jgi:hypothetical protein
MQSRRSLLRAATFLAAVVPLATAPQQASALFGPVCVPHISNCFCTYLIPCPVADIVGNAQKAIDKTRILEAMQLMKDIKNPQAMLLKVVTGSAGLGIPGIDAIGIDLNGVLSGDLTSLGLSSEVTKLAGDLQNLGIDANMLGRIASGQVAPADFLTVAEGAGLDLGVLESAGIPKSLIQGIASGNVSSSDLLSVAASIGGKADFLDQIGITPQLFEGIASGNVSPDALFAIAQKSGLDTDALAAVGLDRETVLGIASGKGPEAIMGIMQRAGLDTSPLSDLGLDNEALAGIMTGKLPASALSQVAAAAGIDPSAIVLPGMDGPISIPSSRLPNREDIISLPVDSIPGLSAVLSSASPASSTEPSGASAAACFGPGSLISVSEPPNGFGADVAIIDFAITGGGDLSVYPEAIADATEVAIDAMAFGAARAQSARPLLTAALESVSTFEGMMNEAKTLKDDFAVNDAISTQLLTARAEAASMMTALVSVLAAKRINAATVSPVPLFPHDSKYKALVDEMHAKKGAGSDAATEIRALAADHSEFTKLARNAVLHHNLIADGTIVHASMAGLIETIDEHEARKNLLFGLETRILAHLRGLYADPEASWEILRPALQSAAGSYFDPKRFKRGVDVAKRLSAALVAQRSSTAFGRRIRRDTSNDSRSYGGRGSDDASSGPEFAGAGISADRYPEIDTHFGGADPFKIVPNSRFVVSQGRDGDSSFPEEYKLVGILQYYLDLSRRVDFSAELRRGNAAHAMTGGFWREMVENAPECLSGPLEASPALLASRPDMFDLASDCEHLAWHDGDVGDYIDPSALGSADAALWMSKISLEKVAARTGGPAAAMAAADTASQFARSKMIATRAAGLGLPTTVQHVDLIMSALSATRRDTSFSARIDWPREP